VFREEISSKLVDIMLYSPMIADMRVSNGPVPRNAEEAIEWIELVRDSVKGLRFGVVQIVVHDAKVVQIETTEKVRIEAGH
jgi:hypothetical protein